jgi:excisionase family DNA binding protein
MAVNRGRMLTVVPPPGGIAAQKARGYWVSELSPNPSPNFVRPTFVGRPWPLTVGSGRARRMARLTLRPSAGGNTLAGDNAPRAEVDPQTQPPAPHDRDQGLGNGHRHPRSFWEPLAMNTQPDLQAAFSAVKAAHYLGLGLTRVKVLVRTGRLPAFKDGRRTVILKTDLDAFLASLPPATPSTASRDAGGKFQAVRA